jgi:hypothetical protein
MLPPNHLSATADKADRLVQIIKNRGPHRFAAFAAFFCSQRSPAPALLPRISQR